MSYSTLNFLLFLGVTVLVYFIFPFKKQRWTVLLAASTVFYLLASYKYAAFILFTTASAYLLSLWLEKMSLASKRFLKENKQSLSKEEKKKHKNSVKVKKRLVTALALVLNFGILAFLKYYNYFAGGLGDVLGIFGVSFSLPMIKLFLPLGISFYTYQVMGYVIDVYRGKTAAQKNPFKLLLFVSFFPQIIQGPISIYDQLAVQLFEPHSFDFTRFKHGCELILWGFFKKLVIADRAVIAINSVTADYNSYGGTTLLFTLVLYSLQIYADFSAGIDISRGAAQILGIDMNENFRRPYFSKSLDEYWRRWHISLGAWMRNYLFYPIAMSSFFNNLTKKIKATRFGKTAAGNHIAKSLPSSFAIFTVFLAVGIWHGASWKYVAYGLWNGTILMLSILLKPVFEVVLKKLRINPSSFLYGLFCILRTYLIVLVSLITDLAPSFMQCLRTVGLIFTDQSFGTGWQQIRLLGLSIYDMALIGFGALVMFAVSVAQERHSDMRLREVIDARPFAVKWLLIFSAVMMIIIFGIYGPGYNAADFVYMQF